MLRLGKEVFLGEALLHLGGLERAEIRASGSPRSSSTPRHALLCLGVGVSSKMQEWTRFGHFQHKSCNQIHPSRNKTTKLT